MKSILVITVIIFIVLLLKVKTKHKGSKNEILPYKKKQYLLTKSEKSFYEDLIEIVDTSKYIVFSKIRIADLIYVNNFKENQGYFWKISSKHCDFVICDKKNISPILAIELDDKSHNKSDRKERDIFVDKAYKSADLDILHIKTDYSKEFLKEEIKKKLN